MNRQRRALDNPINWSFGIGRVFGIRIKLHIFFILGAIVILLQGVRAADGAALSGLIYGAGSLGILFLLVLLHEFGHCAGARYVGGQAEEILMWPLGGLASLSTPHTPRANLITAVAGPAVNVAVCLLIALVLIAVTGSGWTVPWNPFGSWFSGTSINSYVQLWLVTVFALSYMLLLFNLAPVFPFDGGRVLQCLLWPSRGYADATKIATGIGMVGAIGFGVLGLITEQMILFFIAVFGYMTCWQQRQMLKMGVVGNESEFGYDFSQGYTSLEADPQQPRRPSFLARRRAAKAAKRQQQEQEAIETHHRRVDAILQKISQEGAASLTPEERRVLETETNRQRTTEQQ